jgi:Tol biopolymer transport system component
MTWSPNGKWIAFHSHQQHSDDIWLQPADRSTPPRKISSDGHETGWPRWSPDGRWIAYATEQRDAGVVRSRLFVIPVDQQTGATEVSQSVPLAGVTGDVEHAEWTPNSEDLIVSIAGPWRTDRAIHLVARQGGLPRLVHRFASEQLSSGIGASPDGRLVAFAAPAAGRFQIFVVPLRGGAAHQVTFDPTDKTQPAWSPDGKQIAFTRYEYRVDFRLLSAAGLR